MTDPKIKNQHTINGNNAKVDNMDEFFSCQSYRPHTDPEQYHFDTLPGSDNDLSNARGNYQKKR